MCSSDLLEVAAVVTDSQLNTLAEAPVYVLRQPESVLSAMDDWNKSTHGKSGLLDRVRASTATESDVESGLVEFLSDYVPAGTSPLCGNSVHQDRRFLVRYLPKLESFFLYRNLDVSTLKELVKRWRPDLVGGYVKQNKHTALADIHESINELRYYRQHFLRV